MTAARSRGLTAVGLVFAGAGVLYFLSATGVAPARAAGVAFGAASIAVLVYLMRTVDPAWLISAGIVGSLFAAHWDQLGVNTQPSPHRIVLIAGLVAVLFRIGHAKERPSLSLTTAHFALAAAVGYAAVSAFAAGTLNDVYSQSTLLDVFGLLPFALFAIAPVAFATERQRTILLGSLVAAGAYLSVTAILEQFNLSALVVPSYIMDPNVGDHFGRARGPFVDAGAEGLALFFCMVAAVIAFATWRRTWPRAIAAGVAILAPVGILETVTRGVWLAAIIGTLLVLATTAGLRRYVAPAIAGGIALVLVAFAVVPGLAAQTRERQNDNAPIYERQNTTAAGLRMIADRPFFGFGWQGSWDRLEPYFRLDPNIPLTGSIAGLHDVYLQYAVDLGVVGLGLWLVAAALGLGGALSQRAPPPLRPWQIGLKACVPAWIVVGLVSPASFAFTTALLWIWAGIVYGRRDVVIQEWRPGRSLSPLAEARPTLS